ncbi:MAG TPA: hypothetical protein VGP92_07440 [Acidimicrobiia bacterium]|nr:hypothetical protein [Acidimicrobiia bacterium]
MTAARLALTLTLLALVGCGGRGAEAPASRTAVLYGDSLSWEAGTNNMHCPRYSACHTETFQEFASAHGNLSLVVRAFPGAAPCDWLKRLPGDLVTYKPDVVMLQTEGDNTTPCMDDPATGSPYPIASAGVYAKYRSDLDSFFGAATATGAKMIVVPPIATNDRRFSEQAVALGRIVTREAARFPGTTTTTQPGSAVTDNGSFTFAKRCLVGETAGNGCRNGLIAVREPTGLHFCPAGLRFPSGCPVYSSGAFRFAKSTVDALISASKDP